MRRFIAHFVLGILAVWLGSVFVPNITTDGKVTTFLLMGFLLAVGEVVILVVQSASSVLLFFIPRGLRSVLLRVGTVGIAAALTAGYGFTALLPGLVGLTILLSLFYWLPFAR